MEAESIWDRIRRKDTEFQVWREANPGPLIEVTSLRSGSLFHVWTPSVMEPPLKPSTYHYIGRQNGRDLHQSAVANPFKLYGESSRPRAIAQYREWLQTQLDGKSDAWRELLKIMEYSLEDRGIALGCWCAPLPCHGDVIRECVMQMYQAGWRP